MSRTGHTIDNADERKALCRLSRLRIRIRRRTSKAGLLRCQSEEVWHPCRSHLHTPFLTRTLHHAEGRRTPAAQHRRRIDQRNGWHGAARQQPGDRGHAPARHFLLQSAGCLPHLLRHARQQTAQGAGSMETATHAPGRKR